MHSGSKLFFILWLVMASPTVLILICLMLGSSFGGISTYSILVTTPCLIGNQYHDDITGQLLLRWVIHSMSNPERLHRLSYVTDLLHFFPSCVSSTWLTFPVLGLQRHNPSKREVGIRLLTHDCTADLCYHVRTF